MFKQSLGVALKTQQRMALLGRLRMAEWIEMPESEFAREIVKIEKDPLFRKLYSGLGPEIGVIRRQRWPRGRIIGSFYEINEQTTAGGERVKVEELLTERKDILPKIQKMGREAFERYFLYAEEAVPLQEIAKRTGLTMDDIHAVNDFLLEIGAQAQFSGTTPTPLANPQNCLARISIENNEPSFEFFSPYWARGLYHIRYDLLEDWKQNGSLNGPELKRLPHLLKRMETVNLRQNTMFRILESLAQLQAQFLTSRREDLKLPISLRQLAHRLDLAASTVSRAAAGRSILLPWGKEIPLIDLLPGRRRILRRILSRWLSDGSRETDASVADKLNKEYGIRVSRRTVNAVRHEVGSKTRKAK